MKEMAQEAPARAATSARSPVVAMAAAVLAFGIAAPEAADANDQIRTGGQFPPIFEYVYRNFAIEAGFMAEQGLDAEFVGFTAGLTGTQALVSGAVDFACDGLSGTMAAIAQGSGAKVVVNINADNTYVIVARDNVGGPDDIAGRTWAISQMGAISQTYAQLWLDHYDIESIEWVPIGGTGARARALIAGQVDATMLTIGEWLRVQDQPGIQFVEYLADVVPPLPLSLCSATAQMINERPDVVQRYVNAILNAVRHARTDEGAADYVAAARLFDEGAISDEEYAQLVEIYLGPEGNMFAIDPNGGMYPEVLAANVRSMAADGTLPRVIPLDEIWDTRFVNAYIGENGWFDVPSQSDGHTLRDMIRR